jgi:hypothetical protein
VPSITSSPTFQNTTGIPSHGSHIQRSADKSGAITRESTTEKWHSETRSKELLLTLRWRGYNKKFKDH